MSKTPNYDAKVKAILEATTPGERTCSLTGEKWMMDEEEIGWYKKFNVPPSALSPQSRWIHLHHFSTGYQWWWNKHAETGKPVLTFHHPGSGIRVLPDNEWFEKDYSSVQQEWDPAKSVFEQLQALRLMVPLAATNSVIPPENSISLTSLGDQNSYFTLVCQSKNSFFSTMLLNGEDCSEAVSVTNASECHNATHSRRIHKCSYVRECLDCMSCDFVFDCRNCENCFGATNQRNKKYLWWNEQLTKEEWEKRRAEVNLSCRSTVTNYLATFDQLLREQAVWPESFNEKSVDSLGEYLTETTNCRYCFCLEPGSLNNFWVSWGSGANGNAFMIGAFQGASGNYLCMNASKSSGCLFCYRVVACDACEYSFACYNCKNCFGCFGLQRKEYCIFNKQYTEEAYWKRVDEIKCAMLERGEYGSFFPASMSTAWKEFSGATLYCLYPQEAMDKLGALTFEQCADGACGEEVMAANIKSPEEVPDCIRDVDDTWTKTPVFDPIANRRFAFLKPELDYYRKFNIAPPNAYFVRRMAELHQHMQSPVFEHRSCAQCGKDMLTSKIATYPERRIYCMSCYGGFLNSR